MVRCRTRLAGRRSKGGSESNKILARRPAAALGLGKRSWLFDNSQAHSSGFLSRSPPKCSALLRRHFFQLVMKLEFPLIHHVQQFINVPVHDTSPQDCKWWASSGNHEAD